MEEQNNNLTPNSFNSYNKWGIIVAVLISAWLIGMSIVIAGYLISKEVAKNNAPVAVNNFASTTPPIQHVDIEVPADIPVLGDNNAKVTIVEFADFQCPYCGEFQKTIFPDIKSKYIDNGKARFVFMDFPFLGDESNKAAEAASCATDQGKFWEYHDTLYANQNGENEGAFADANLKKFAKQVGLNTTDFNSCFESRKHQADITASVDKGTGYGVQSTPTIFINGNKYEGVLPLLQYQTAIEAELAK